jgi:hypothetical protein
MKMEAARTSETSVDNNFTRQYIPEDNSELQNVALLIISRWGIYLLLGFKGLRQKGQYITTCLLSGMPEA